MYRDKKKDHEVDTLKGVIKSNNSEQNSLTVELKKMKQTLKSKEKDIYNLENEKLNLMDKIKRFKEVTSNIKKEKSSLEKQLKQNEKKVTLYRFSQKECHKVKMLTSQMKNFRM